MNEEINAKWVSKISPLSSFPHSIELEKKEEVK